MILEKGSKLLMIGDSVTDCGRLRPVGEGFGAALGSGYPLYVDGLLKAVYPERRIRVVNMGISGNTAMDLKKRWRTDVEELEPQYVSVMIGVNDVWRQFDMPLQPEWCVPLDDYAEILDDLTAKTKKFTKGIILMTPFFIEPNQDEPMRKRMDEYGRAVSEIAKKHGTAFVDTQAAFDGICAHFHSYMMANDRVHPNHAGHTVLTRAFLNGVGFDWAKCI